MESGRASKTALRVAIRRAAHQIMEQPRILDDPIAVRLLGPGFARDMERASHRVARDFRAFMAARSRYAEDRLAEAVANGVAQYVVLGAGLDTFAYRNPFPALRVFEVDFPATQEGSGRCCRGGIALPAGLTFVPLDFEHKRWPRAGRSGVRCRLGGIFRLAGGSALSHARCLSRDPGRNRQLPAGSAVSFDYAVAPETLSPKRPQGLRRAVRRVAAAGEPFQLFFTPSRWSRSCAVLDSQRIEQVDSEAA
jgi:O-methyltransferase involved in polyketide biosynthesis